MELPSIRLYGDPVLTAANTSVDCFDASLEGLVQTMLQVAWAEPGLGLAAPQIGHNIRLAVLDLSVGADPGDILVLANPTMTAREGSRVVTEGCLSFPGLFTRLRRPERVTVRAQDVHGHWHEHHAQGKLAQAMCHELDHLDGILIPDRLSPLRRWVFLARTRWALRRSPKMRSKETAT